MRGARAPADGPPLPGAGRPPLAVTDGSYHSIRRWKRKGFGAEDAEEGGRRGGLPGSGTARLRLGA